MIYKGSSSSSCNPFLNSIWKLYGKYLFQNKILPYLLTVMISAITFPKYPNCPRALSAGKTTHCGKDSGTGQLWYRSEGRGRRGQDRMGQPALAVLGSRTRPGARSRRDTHLLPMAGQSCTPIPASAMLWGECISSAAVSVTTGGTWPLLDLKVRFGTCRFVKAFDKSGVNLSGFLWEVPGKHRKCISSCIFQHSLQATLSWVFFPSGYPYQQFGFRHLASPLTHSYSPCTDCIKQWAFALHHYSGSWLPAERCLDFLWHKGTRTPSESKMQISGSYSVLRTADFVSQQ